MNRNEMMIMLKMHELCVAQGWRLHHVDDGEDKTITSSIKEAIFLGCNLDDVRLYYKHDNVKGQHGVYYIFGNGDEGLTVLSDCSGAFSNDLDKPWDLLYRWTEDTLDHRGEKPLYKRENFEPFFKSAVASLHGVEMIETLEAAHAMSTIALRQLDWISPPSDEAHLLISRVPKQIADMVAKVQKK